MTEETNTATTGGMFRSLRNYNARLFFLGLLVSNVGSWLQFTATSFLLYDLTGSATDLGINSALQFLPTLVLGAWAGSLSDHFNRQRTTAITQTLMALQALTLGILDLAGAVNVPIVYLLTFSLGVIGAIDNPARRALVTELVDERDMTNALSLNTAVMTGSRIFGPALAASLVGPLGTGWLFVANGVSYAAMIAGVLGLRKHEMRVAPRAPKGGTPVRDALRFVVHHEKLLVTFIVFTLVSTFAFNYGVALPKLADEVWGNEKYFGWVLAVTSFGSMLGALINARKVRITYRWVASMTIVLGVANIGLAWAPNIVVAFLWSVPLGVGGAAMISSANSITQQESPPDMRGRLLALTAVAFLGSTPIGGPVTGWVADVISVHWALAYGGIIAVVSGTAMLVWILSRHPEHDVAGAGATSQA
jgi:MFS family permease